MCKWGDVTSVKVKISADLAYSGKSYWREMQIDKCIASTVEALQKVGINMRSSCCGHNKAKSVGHIELEDGRVFFIL